jgi:hypothetical protein
LTIKTPAPAPVGGNISDGCTGFIDGIGEADWRHCCVAHDHDFLVGESVTDFVVANIQLGICVVDEGWSTATEIAAEAPANDVVGWSLTMLEAGAYLAGLALVAMAMFLAVATVGWLFFLKAPSPEQKQTPPH